MQLVSIVFHLLQVPVDLGRYLGGATSLGAEETDDCGFGRLVWCLWVAFHRFGFEFNIIEMKGYICIQG